VSSNGWAEQRVSASRVGVSDARAVYQGRARVCDRLPLRAEQPLDLRLNLFRRRLRRKPRDHPPRPVDQKLGEVPLDALAAEDPLLLVLEPPVEGVGARAVDLDLFSEGAMSEEYAQTLIDVQTPDGQTVQAFLYHLADDDSDDYAGTQRRQRAIPPVPIAVLMQTGAVATEVAVEIGKDGRARIPRDFLERAGLTSGQVHVEPTGSPTVLRLCEPADATAPAMVTLVYSHPTLLHLPTTWLAGFDLTRPILAKVANRGVTVEKA